MKERYVKKMISGQQKAQIFAVVAIVLLVVGIYGVTRPLSFGSGYYHASFYASKINAFKMTSEGPDGYKSIYLCQTSIIMAVVWSVMELALIGFAVASVIHCRKEKTRRISK